MSREKLKRNQGWLVVLATMAIALATCGLAELGGSEAEGQLRPALPEPAPAAPDPLACRAAAQGARLLHAAATCAECAPSEAAIELLFDRVVDTERALDRVRVSPEVRLEVRVGTCARRVLIGGDFNAQTNYEITVDAGDDERVMTIETGGGSPHVRMPAPMAVLATDGGLPVQLREVGRARLRVMALGASEIARAAESAGTLPGDRDPTASMPVAWRARLVEIPVDPSAGDDQGIQRVDAFGPVEARGPVLAILEVPGAATRVTIAQRQHNAVILKVGDAGGIVWVADPRTGEPVANAAVSIWEGTARRHRGRTDRAGLLRLPASSRLRGPSARPGPGHHVRRDAPTSGRSPLRAVVEAGRHVTYASESFNTGIERWQLGLPRSAEGVREVRGMVTAERGIYRPGESVHLLGVVRELAADGSLRAPRGQVSVDVLDPDGSTIHHASVALSAYGTFREELTLPSGARLGRYQVLAGPAGQMSMTARFEVGEYRADTFSVQVPPPGPAELDDGELVFPVRAQYLYGAPVREASARWTLSWRPRRIQLAGHPEFAFGPHDAPPDYARFLTSGEIALDADGAGELRLPRTILPANESVQAIDLIFEASVRDAAGDTVAGRTVQSVATRERWVGVRNTQWVVNQARGWTVSVVAVHADGRPATGETIRARLVHPTWRAHAERGTGGVRYDGGWQDVVVAEREVRSAAHPRELRFELPEAGRYRVELVGDADEVLASARVWAYGRAATGPVYNHPRMELLADRESYQPGERATVFAQVPWERSMALVTVEREGVLDARVVRLDGAGTPIEVPIARAHAPNVYVGVAALPITTESPASGVPLRVGYRELSVSAEERRLDVTVRPAEDDYEPGETAAVDVTVRDHRGRPVRAEITLWAADEGVLQLTGYQTPDPFAPAYARHSLGVRSSASAAQWTQGDPYTWPDGGGDAPSGAVGALRSRFLSTAFFSSRGVVTNAAGRARVRFPLPDNLTRWRVMAAVADRGERFGRGESAVTTSKPLSALPTLPRFLTQGDLVDAGVVVHNRTGAGGTAVVRLSVDGPAEVLGGDVQRVSIEDGAQLPVRFPVIARGVGEVTVRAHVTLGEATDGWRRSLTANPATSWTARRVSDGELSGVAESWLRVPRSVQGRQVEAVLTVSRGVYAEMEGGLDALIRYPHGCVEQTTSGLIPMVLLEELMNDLGSERLASGEHRARMQAAVDHVLRHQNTDGGFGLWPASSSEGFLTAYALWGLLTARDHGYAVPADRVEAAKRYLEENATQGGDMHGQFSDREIPPFAAYVLAYARHEDGGLARRLAREPGSLSEFSVGLLANALTAREQAGTAPLLTGLLEAAEPAREGALIADPNGGGRYMTYGSNVRATSSAVQALVAAGRRDEAWDLVAGILGARRADGTWGTTYNNMWALYALTAYAQSGAGRGEAEGQVTVRLGDRDVATVRLDDSARARQIRIPASSLPGAGRSERLVLTGPSGADLRYSVRLRYVPSAEEQAPTSHGLSVTRELLDAHTGVAVEHPQVGQLVRVRLRARATHALEQVAVMDYLPAGFEAIDPRLETRATEGATVGAQRGWAWQEVHDERVTFFADRLRGERTAEYLARVTRSGEFVRPAPRAEAMYDPAVFGVGAIERVIVRRASATP